MDLLALRNRVRKDTASVSGLTRLRIERELEDALLHYHRNHWIYEAPPDGGMISENFTWTSGSSHNPVASLTNWQGRVVWIKSATYDQRWEAETDDQIEDADEADVYEKHGRLVYCVDGRTIRIATTLTSEVVTIKHLMLPPCYDYVTETAAEAAGTLTYMPWGRTDTADPMFPAPFHEMLALRAALACRGWSEERVERVRLTGREVDLRDELKDMEKKFAAHLARRARSIAAEIDPGVYANALYERSDEIRR